MPALVRRLARGNERGERGQSMVEMSIVVPVILLLMLSMLEFGFAFDHTLTLQYATREGARYGAALGPGTTSVPCDHVDSEIITAVPRVLTSPGSRVVLANVSEIDIYEAAADGSVSGSQMNVWKYSSSSVPPFTNYSTGWNACTLNARRYDTNPPDSIGVALIYRYDFVTPLGGILRFFGGTAISSLGISDKAVMALNPHN